jgi:hypothetical protein
MSGQRVPCPLEEGFEELNPDELNSGWKKHRICLSPLSRSHRPGKETNGEVEPAQRMSADLSPSIRMSRVPSGRMVHVRWQATGSGGLEGTQPYFSHTGREKVIHG